MAVTGAAIAAFLQKELHGDSLPVTTVADLAHSHPGALVWVLEYTPQRLEIIETQHPSLVICDAATAEHTSRPHICAEKPRLTFIRALTHFFTPPKPPPTIHPTALIAPEASLGDRLSIGAYARIGPHVSIGDDCVIGSGVVLEGKVQIGKRCRIKANSVLGAEGFGFEYDEKGVPIHFPHLGKVVLEDEVWIGACSTVERAALSETRLCHGVKVDDLVQVGHNVTIGPRTLITAHVVICGRAVVEEDCWLAPNSVIKEGVHVARNVKVGLGAVVIRDVEPNWIVAGVPAKPLRKQ